MSRPPVPSTDAPLLADLEASSAYQPGKPPPAAWWRFEHRYRPLLAVWCARYHPAGGADGAVDRVLAKLAQSIRGFRYDPTKGQFRSWLRSVVRCVVCDLAREADRHPVLPAHGGSSAYRAMQQAEDPAGTDDLVDNLAAPLDEDVRRVREARDRVISQVEPRTWEVFVATELKGRSNRQVAADFGMTEPAVRNARSRVKRLLRTAFNRPEQPRDGKGPQS